MNKMKQSEYKKLLLTVVLFWSIIPTCFGIFYNSTESLLYYNRFIWLVVVYLIGGYIRLYSMQLFSKHSILLALLSFASMLLGMLFIHKYRYGFSSLGTTQIAYFWPPNTLPMLILSISVFYIFLNIKMKHIKIINIFASTTLGIYMLHDGILLRYIWDVIFKTKEHLLGG